jgi:hypothetical protein
LLTLSCAGDDGTVAVDAQWNLTCPVGSEVGCGSLAEDTCLGDVGQRAIVGARGDSACTGDPIIASCQAIDRPNGLRAVFLEAKVGDGFEFLLSGAAVDPADGSIQGSACNVTVVEDGLPYDVGACGGDPPSMDQPCQLSNIATDGGEVAFDLQCRSLLSSTSGLGFDVGAVGGGPTTIRFSNCTGF